MSIPNSQRQQVPVPSDTPAPADALEDDDEVTDVMDRKDLPDFEVEEESDKPRAPRNRPSTFTRLLLDKRQS